jgi:hypothetical protein
VLQRSVELAADCVEKVHAETLLAAVRHLITNESCAPNLSQPGSRHGPSFMRFAETMIT